MLNALSIIFSCLLLLYICWQVVHLNKKGRKK